VRLAYRDGWGLPGGLVKRREDIGSCAQREVREEVGLEIDLVGEPAVVVEVQPQRVDVVFRARPTAGAPVEFVEPTSAELTEARWFAPGALPELQPEAVSAFVALARWSAVPTSWPVPAGAADPGKGTRTAGSTTHG
jgi:ADP-ribose pyrophosphatase YjhB (NUDIX family)